MPDLLTQREVAALLRTSLRGVRGMLRRAELGAVMVSPRKVLIPRGDLERFVQRRAVPACR